jgi:hypothetical protein
MSEYTMIVATLSGWALFAMLFICSQMLINQRIKESYLTLFSLQDDVRILLLNKSDETKKMINDEFEVINKDLTKASLYCVRIYGRGAFVFTGIMFAIYILS